MQSVRIRMTDSRHMSIPSSPLGSYYRLARRLFFIVMPLGKILTERGFSDLVLLVECWFKLSENELSAPKHTTKRV